jgi:hypothetical protein
MESKMWYRVKEKAEGEMEGTIYFKMAERPSVKFPGLSRSSF